MPTRTSPCMLGLLYSLSPWSAHSARVTGEHALDLEANETVALDGAANATVSAPKDFLSVMTWNVEKLGGIANAQKDQGKYDYINGRIVHEVNNPSGSKPDIIFLQEARSCYDVTAAVEATDFECVDSTVSPDYEAKMSMTVLGTIILFNPNTLEPGQGSWNRALKVIPGKGNKPDKYVKDNSWVNLIGSGLPDKKGRTLSEVHTAGCTWGKYSKGKGCSNAESDVPLTNSVKLYMKTNAFNTNLATAFENGIRAMNVHLFSGGHGQELTDQEKSDRRAFQMRGLFWLNALWNSKDGGKYPTTIWAGDFNTYTSTEIDTLMKSAADYSTKTWFASDRVKGKRPLKTNRHGGTLDYVILSGTKENTATRVGLRTSTTMEDQTNGWKKDGPKSDHNPVIVQIYAYKMKKPEPVVVADWMKDMMQQREGNIAADKAEEDKIAAAAAEKKKDDDFPSLG